MNLAEQLEILTSRGFSEERAETVVLMREAAIVLFEAFPDVLLLVGGASLILFQNSVRHSADLDFVPLGTNLPRIESLTGVLAEGLRPLAQLLDLAPLSFKTLNSEPDLTKFMVLAKEGKPLFTIDISGIGSVIQQGAEAHALEATGLARTANVKSASRDHLLLQKAQAFLLRRVLKARDAYDIHLLLNRGARLSGNLEKHLEDMLVGEFDSERIRERIEQVDSKLCRADLTSILPAAEYGPLEESDFETLRDALRHVFKKWL
jgi:nucleotidyltransferase AbiEii toxin of type IV toxin-antitoxin system